MQVELTAVFQRVPEGYIAFVEELPGANAQALATPDQRVVEIAALLRGAERLHCCRIGGELRFAPVPALDEAVAQRASGVALRPVVAARDVEHARALRAVAFPLAPAAPGPGAPGVRPEKGLDRRRRGALAAEDALLVVVWPTAELRAASLAAARERVAA